MGLLKKNPVFCILCIVFLLIFAGGLALVVIESGKLSKSEQLVAGAESRINGLLSASPALTVENVEASKQNVEELKQKLLSLRENLQRGSRLTMSNDGVNVMAGIQQYITRHQKKAANHVDEAGESAPIQVPEDFAFGFARYIDKAKIPEDPSVIPMLDKQRQVLTYIVNQLMATNPLGIKAIRREMIEGAIPGGKAGTAFVIDPAISARVPGAINTMAFSVTFTGTTRSLRQFLNNLAQFDLPIVVRSVEVDRPSSGKSGSKPKKKKSNLDDMFGGFGGDTSGAAATEAPQASQTPVISETESSFTVTLEFIEIILPNESQENPAN